MYIRYCFPYSLDKKLGQAYNKEFETVGDDDWVCLKDADVAFLTPDYGSFIVDIINAYPHTGGFTCFTNRIGNRWQRYPGMFDEKDITVHHAKAKLVRETHGYSATILHKPISGMVMIVSKKAWNQVKFKEEGILRVDNDFSKRILQKRIPIRRIDGLYVLHYYRFNEGANSTTHLK